MDYGAEVVRRFDSALDSALGADRSKVGMSGAVRGDAEDRALNVWVRIHVEVNNGRIAAAHFQVFGCPHTVAAASWVAQWLEGRDIQSLTGLDTRGIARDLDIPVKKMGKVLRIEDAMLACWRELVALGLANAEKGS